MADHQIQISHGTPSFFVPELIHVILNPAYIRNVGGFDLGELESKMIDDDEQIRRVIGEMLEGTDFDVVLATDAVEGLLIFKSERMKKYRKIKKLLIF